MKVSTYKITLKHDNGYMIINACGPSKKTAIKKVMYFENCPECAILRVEKTAHSYCRY